MVNISASKGFSLIELIAVVVVLGTITAVALPRFVNLSAAAQQASTEAVAASLGSSSALNYAADILVRAADEGAGGLPAPVPIQSCDDGDLPELLNNGIPPGYRVEVAPGAPASVEVGERTSCRVISESDDAIFAAFTLHGTGP